MNHNPVNYFQYSTLGFIWPNQITSYTTNLTTTPAGAITIPTTFGPGEGLWTAADVAASPSDGEEGQTDGER